MTTTEKSVEEMAKELAHEINDIFAIACKLEGEVNQEWLVNVIKEPLQAERQKREEVVEAEKTKYKNIIHEAYNVGFNEDCIQCGLKDKALGKGL